MSSRIHSKKLKSKAVKAINIKHHHPLDDFYEAFFFALNDHLNMNTLRKLKLSIDSKKHTLPLLQHNNKNMFDSILSQN